MTPPSSRPAPPPARNFRRLILRLEEAGFGRAFVERALLPAWWSKECAKDASVLPEVEFGVARFLGRSLADVRDPTCPLVVKDVPGVQLRHHRNFERQSLLAAVHAGLQVAGAVMRNLRNMPPLRPIPDDPLVWRADLLAQVGAEAVTLHRLVQDLWLRGIPVVHCPHLPAPKFRGMACLVGGRPCLLLGWGGQEQPRFLWDLAHEAGHLARGHVKEGMAYVDDVAQEEALDDAPPSEPEQREAEANTYAKLLLVGQLDAPEVFFSAADAHGVKTRARWLGAEHRIDTGLLALWWAGKTGNNAIGAVATRLLHKLEAGPVLSGPLRHHIALDEAPETDQALLRCVLPEASDAPAF